MKHFGLNELLDILVIGVGPAGLGVLYSAKQAGLRAVGIDKGPVCSALASHPTYMRWFSTFDKLELAGFPLLVDEKNPTRREYLRYCRTFARYFELEVVTYRTVTHIEREEDRFRVRAVDMFGREYEWEARNVVAATGFYDDPRPLNVPGEGLPKTTHRYTEAHWYVDHDVLIVGAGSSAAEVALELYRAGANVTVAMREQKFNTKYWIEPDIENRIKEGSIACHRGVEIKEIRPDEVVLERHEGGEVVVPNDFVLAMTGYKPNTDLVEGVGVEIDESCGKPVLDDNLETNVPGLFVAGTLCAGDESNIVFVENSREHGPLIVDCIAERTAAAKA